MKNTMILAVAGLLLLSVPFMAKACPEKGKVMKDMKMCQESMTGVETTKINIDNGVELTLVGEDAQSIVRIQKKAAEHYGKDGKICERMPKGADVKIENLENGIKVTITGNNPKLIKKIQDKLKKSHKIHALKKSMKMNVKAKKYICPMGHYNSDKPGECPKCGMKLIKNNKVKTMKMNMKESNHQKNMAVVHKVRKEEIGKKAVCPVLGNEFTVSENTKAVSYKGKIYYFCCPGCAKPFMENPEKQLNKNQ